MNLTQLMWLNVWRRIKFYTAHPKNLYRYLRYVTYGIRGHVTTLGINIKVLRIEVLKITRNNMINIKEGFTHACCDNYVLMVRGNNKHTLVFEMKFFERWIRLNWWLKNPYFEFVLIPNKIITIWFEQDSWRCNSNRWIQQSFWDGESMWCTDFLCELCLSTPIDSCDTLCL